LSASAHARNRPSRVLLAHGSGGRATAELIRELFLPRFANEHLSPLADAAVLPRVLGDHHPAASQSGSDPPPGQTLGGRLVLTTDAFVVSPLFFPGGDIGKLAVFGTVNDLAVSGATPLYLTAAFILEEGLDLADLERVAASMASAAEEVGVAVVAGDTKVVEKGACDGLFVTTTGVGQLHPRATLGPSAVRPGDRLVLSGRVGDHGVAVLSCRPGLAFETTVRSDCASVAPLARALLDRLGPAVRWMRDPTRGGVATVAYELGGEASLPVLLDEEAVPVSPDVAAACDLLGLDPLYLANEGKVLAVVAQDSAEEAVRVLNEAGASDAAVVGEILPPGPGLLGRPGAYLRTAYGGTRPLEPLEGDQLPRIC